MKLTKEQQDKFEETVRPVIAFLNEHCYPHTHVVIDTSRAELSEGVCSFATNEYVKD